MSINDFNVSFIYGHMREWCTVMMVKNEKKYRNYEKTDVAIKEALVKLCVQKNSIKKVTVKELCEEANISKSTFYLHYANIDDIFESVGDKFLLTFENMFNELVHNKTTDFLIFIQRIIDYVNESSDIIKIGLTFGQPFGYYVNGIKDQLEQAISNSFHFKDAKFGKKQFLIEVKIVTSGIIDFIIELLRSKKPNELEKNSIFINEFLSRWISSFENTK